MKKIAWISPLLFRENGYKDIFSIQWWYLSVICCLFSVSIQAERKKNTTAQPHFVNRAHTRAPIHVKIGVGKKSEGMCDGINFIDV